MGCNVWYARDMFAGVMLFQAIGLLSCGLLMTLCVIAIWRTITVPPELSRATSCGGCGHEISTLGAGRCPECGGDLLRVGLATRRMAITLRGSLPMALLGWTVLVGLGTAIIGYVVAMAVMMSSFSAGGGGFSTTMSGRISPGLASAAPRAAPNYTIGYTLDSSMGGVGITGTLELDLVGPGSQQSIATIDLSNESYSIVDSTGVQIDSGPRFNAAAAQKLYQSAGLTPTGDAELTAETDELALWVRDASRQPFAFGQNFSMGGRAAASPLTATQTSVTSNAGTFAGGSSSGMTALAVGVAVVLAVYIIGLVLIVRRRGKLLRG